MTGSIRIDLLLEIAAAIVVLGGACAYINKALNRLTRPITDLKDKVCKHEELLDKDNKRLKEVEDTTKELLESQRHLMRSQLAILEHLETDNATGKMAEAKEDIHEFLINR